MLIQPKTLRNALGKLIGIVPSKPSVPILENVLIKQGEKLKLIVTDLEIFGVAELTFTKSDKIDFCVNAKRLYDTVKMIEDEQIISTGYLKDKKYSLMLYATRANDSYDDQMNKSIYPLASENGVNLYKSCK